MPIDALDMSRPAPESGLTRLTPHRRTRPVQGALLLVGLSACTVAIAQAWRIVPEVQATVTATDNAGFDESNAERKDLILAVSPSIRIAGRGPQYTIDGQLGLNALYYSRESEPNRILPNGRVALSAAPVPRWLLLDAVVSVDQTAADPFEPQPTEQSTVNRLTSARLTVSPALKHDFSDIDTVELRTTQTWTRLRGETDATGGRSNSHAQAHLFRLERRPAPLGGAVELSREETRYGSVVALESTAARALLSFAPDPQMSFGVVVGRERTRFSFTESSDSIIGLRADLAPTERSRILASVERRYFGTGWDVEARHRSPFVALSAQFVRRATAQTSSTVLGGGAGTASLLDSMLTSRYPDPTARAAVVQDLVDRLGLPAKLGQPVEVFSDTAQLEQGSNFTAAFMGRLTVVTLGLFSRQFEQLQRADDPLPPVAGYDQANRQRGISLGFNRRLSALTSLDLLLRWSRIEGLGARDGDVNEERDARVALVHQLSARSTWTIGASYRSSDATLVGLPTAANETTVFMGLGHRF